MCGSVKYFFYLMEIKKISDRFAFAISVGSEKNVVVKKFKKKRFKKRNKLNFVMKSVKNNGEVILNRWKFVDMHEMTERRNTKEMWSKKGLNGVTFRRRFNNNQEFSVRRKNKIVKSKPMHKYKISEVFNKFSKI